MKKFTKILMALSLVGTVYVPMLSHAELQKPRQIKLQDNQFVTLMYVMMWQNEEIVMFMQLVRRI